MLILGQNDLDVFFRLSATRSNSSKHALQSGSSAPLFVRAILVTGLASMVILQDWKLNPFPRFSICSEYHFLITLPCQISVDIHFAPELIDQKGVVTTVIAAGVLAAAAFFIYRKKKGSANKSLEEGKENG